MGEIRRVPHCSHWGAYTILVEDGRIVGVEPFAHDPAPSPIIRSVGEWASPERRVPRPMVREGWLAKRERSDRRGRGRERFVPVSWDEAIALVAGEIRRVAGDFGNASIFGGSYGWTNSGRVHHSQSLLRRMLNLAGGYTGHVDTYSTAAGPVILRHVLGSDAACNGRSSTLDTIAEHTRTLVVFGAITPRTAQIESGGIARHTIEADLRRIAAGGARVVLVSPVRDDLPEYVGAEWWPIRPNTDTALMLGLAGEIVAAGRHDRDFLDRCTSGADVFLRYLDGSADGVRKDAAWAAAITGLDAGAIAALARTLVETRSLVSVSWSLQRAQHGEQPFWAALGLAAVTGQVGLPGGGVGYGYASLGGVGAAINLGLPPAMPQGRKAIDSFIPVARISDMLLNPGKPFSYEGKVRAYPDVRMVYWAGGNPYHHHQDLNRLEAAWARPETIVVQDPMFTATAQRADIVLPASTSIERNDLAGNRRADFILAMKKAVEPLGESRSDFDIFGAIAGRLGLGERFTEGRDEMGWIRHLYETSRSDAAARHGFEMPDFEAFWEAGYARCPTRTEHTYLAEFRERPEEHRLHTESGRIVLGSSLLAGLGYADCRAHPAWIEPAEWLGAARDGGQFHLISSQPQGRLHSQLETGEASRAQKRGGREQVRINPADAARLGIADGQTVRLFNERGACLATAAVSGAVRQGVVVLPTGAWFTPVGNSGLEVAGNPNVLTLDVGTSAFGQGCSAHTCLVRVEAYADNPGDAFEIYRERLAEIAA
jgi:biotin/methionine sulfoxide reductase